MKTTDTLFVQFDPADDHWPAGVTWHDGAAWVDTKIGPAMLRPGDWIVTDPDGGRRVVADEDDDEDMDGVTVAGADEDDDD